jgi:hypothetical protein
VSSIFSRRFSACNALLLTVSALGGCAAHAPLSLQGSVTELDRVPFFPQTEFECGPAALATLLVHERVAVTPEELAPAVYVEGLQGSLQAELLGATRRHGLIPYPLAPDPEQLLAEIASGKPVLVMQNLGLRHIPVWHYAVVIGFDAAADQVILRSGTQRRRMERSRRFMRSWTLADRWAFVAAQPGIVPVTASPEPYLRAVVNAAATLPEHELDAAYAAALERWPARPLVLFASANHAQSQQRWRDAAELYEHVLRYEPGHAAARNNLAYALFESGCEAEALTEARAALAAQAPGDAFYSAIASTLRELEQRRGRKPRECSLAD